MNALVKEIEAALADQDGAKARELLAESAFAIYDRDDAGATLLHHAAAACDSATVCWLMGVEGCDINARDNKGLTALDHAAVLDRVEVVERLIQSHNYQHRSNIERPDFFNYDKEGHSSAWRAHEAGAKEVELLLDSHAKEVTQRTLDNADPRANLANEFGYTALHWAVIERDWRKVAGLVDRGANPNATTQLGEGPMWTVVRNGDMEGFEVLCGQQRGFSVTAFNLAGESLLHAAADSGNPALFRKVHERIKTAVEAGGHGSLKGYLERANNKGHTPAHGAAAGTRPQAFEMAETLLELGIQESLAATTDDTYEEVPARLALQHGNMDIAALFFQAMDARDIGEEQRAEKFTECSMLARINLRRCETDKDETAIKRAKVIQERVEKVIVEPLAAPASQFSGQESVPAPGA